LVRRGLASGRDQAKRLIESGDVLVNGSVTVKAASLVGADAAVRVVETSPGWASRAGNKLDGAIREFGIEVEGSRVLDVGASTGGFTDVALHHGATAVTAIDVGYGQMLWRLSQDPRVTVIDRTNFRTVDIDSLDPPYDLVVVDVSFISVRLLATNLAAVGRAGTVYVVLVKPQFEVGRSRVGTGGIVRDRSAHRDAITDVATALSGEGIGPLDVAVSPITGSKGNVEFLLHATQGAEPTLPVERIDQVVTT